VNFPFWLERGQSHFPFGSDSTGTTRRPRAALAADDSPAAPIYPQLLAAQTPCRASQYYQRVAPFLPLGPASSLLVLDAFDPPPLTDGYRSGQRLSSTETRKARNHLWFQSIEALYFGLPCVHETLAKNDTAESLSEHFLCLYTGTKQDYNFSIYKVQLRT
jgi:hypothetical protein